MERAREIVDGYAPLKVTLRQVMYRLAAEGVLPHTPPMYRRLSAQLAQARREGRFPDLIDTVREVHVPPAWDGADAFVAEMPDWFRLDRTAGQEHALYVGGRLRAGLGSREAVPPTPCPASRSHTPPSAS